VADFVASASTGRVRVSSPDCPRLRKLIAEKATEVSPIEAGVDGNSPTFTVSGLGRSAIGDLAFQQGIVIHELTSEAASLEEAFMELTAGDVEFRAQDPSHPAPQQAAPVAATRKVVAP
jgi:ABC-2 type transport system ATP-binding protein